MQPSAAVGGLGSAGGINYPTISSSAPVMAPGSGYLAGSEPNSSYAYATGSYQQPQGYLASMASPGPQSGNSNRPSISYGSPSAHRPSNSNGARPSFSGGKPPMLTPGPSGTPTANEYYEIADPQTGKTFFANITNGDCTWDRPTNAFVHPKDPNGNEWWELFDQNHKLPYYYSTKTGETEWIRPERGTVIPLIAIQNSTIGKRVSMILNRNSMMGSAGFAETAALLAGKATPVGNNQPPSAAGAGSSPLASSPKAFPGSPKALSQELVGQPRPATNTNAWAAAKAGGISSPVNNPEAAARMNPLVQSNSLGALKAPPTPSNPILESLPKVKPDHMLPEELKRHIAQFRIDGFAKKYFSEHRRGIFRRKVPMETMLQYQKEALRAPLMSLPRNLHKEAIKCFKQIQKILADTSRPPYSAVSKDMQQLLERGILMGGLRDEIYVQICKQVTKNPSAEQTFRGWLLMGTMAIGFPPSKNFEEYLKSFAAAAFDGPPTSWADGNPAFKWVVGPEGKRIGTVATHVHRCLVRICKAGARGKTPAISEIERAQEAPFQALLFGETLSEIMRAQEEAEDKEARESGEPVRHLSLPKILLFLADSILKLNGCQTEGIFRVPGDIDMVNDLRVRVEKGNYDLTNITDPNVPSSLLKLWLRELAEPLIPSDRYDLCVAVGHEEHAEHSGKAAADIVATLPDINKKVVLYMIKFLKVVADPINHALTKMTHANIAMVFAPNFLRCPSDNPTVIFENTKFEQAFLRVLMTQSNLDNL